MNNTVSYFMNVGLCMTILHISSIIVRNAVLFYLLDEENHEFIDLNCFSRAK